MQVGFVPLCGGCACNGVRYRMLAPPLIVHCCHCRSCQRETGTAFALNALIESQHIEVLAGRPDPVDTPSASGRGQRILRCSACEVALWSHYVGFGADIGFVRVGTLDDPDGLPPDIHIYTESKQPWVVLPTAVRAVPQYYRTREVWSAESLARLDRCRRSTS
ncbi:MAG TPA: GFA family protein [Steroidobacteraceae bacterium]|nr:GFA family protein [Steroidobacteraceae bacterium]